jgi:hypothetical protein
MERNKAAGPDGIPIEFFQTCWDFIKSDMIDLFDDFYLGPLDIKRINYGIITLLPKVKDAKKSAIHAKLSPKLPIQMITKFLTIRLESVARRVIHKSQTTFFKRKEHYEYCIGSS